MTLDEEIKKLEEIAIEEDKLCKRYDDASGYTRSYNEKIRTTDAIKCEYSAAEHRQLAEWLKELKQLREQTKWIPISEKMPEEETDVLICNSKGNIEVSRGSVFDDGTWEWYTSGWHFGEVIAWQPLPKPYKTESEK